MDVEGIGVLTVKLRDRLTWLYEALVLLCGLIEACKRMQNGRYRQSSETGELGGNSRTSLEFFSNKLAQICDNQPFGSTITALAIIQKPDKIQYIITSNQRSPEDAQSAVITIRKLLDKMALQTRADVRDDDRSPVFRELLRSILLFHTQRVTLYESRLNQRLDQCIEELKTRSLDAGMFSINQANGVCVIQLRYSANLRKAVSPGKPLLDELEHFQVLIKPEVSLDDSEECKSGLGFPYFEENC